MQAVDHAPSDASGEGFKAGIRHQMEQVAHQLHDAIAGKLGSGMSACVGSSWMESWLLSISAPKAAP
jgi:hypothetical protein